MSNQRALLVLTSHAQLGETDNPTGFYWEEMATPYYALKDHGIDVDIASVVGGEPPADPSSATEDTLTDSVKRFQSDDQAMKALKNTAAIATVDTTAYDAIFFPGGHGTMWDLRQTAAVGEKIAAAFENGRIIAAVCHGPSALLGATLANGDALVKGRKVNGFTNSEEKAAGLTDVVPFLLQSELEAQGGIFEKNDKDFGMHAVRDGHLITGQNPASSAEVARLILEALDEAPAAT